jgi:deferrochelatase/peroxidase EfeB
VHEWAKQRRWSISRRRAEQRWRAVAAGEFVFGYESEGGEVPPMRRARDARLGPDAATHDAQFFDLLQNGTYMVWRKLHQDVAAFRRFVSGAAEQFPEHGAMAEPYVRAKLVGRWPDGIPLALAPTPAEWWRLRARGDVPLNTFSFHDDPDGLKTPLGAHIRRTAPRDTAGTRNTHVIRGDLTRRRRILRRGIPYGVPLAEGATTDDNLDRGLIFVALNTNIAGQFELVQRAWVNHGDFVRQAIDRDPLIGTRSEAANQYVIPGVPRPTILADVPAFVSLRAGDYLFVPSLHAIRGLARGDYRA